MDDAPEEPEETTPSQPQNYPTTTTTLVAPSPPTSTSSYQPPTTHLSVELLSTAQKYTKFASSALNFDDVPTAILNLKKALSLLETGVELAE